MLFLQWTEELSIVSVMEKNRAASLVELISLSLGSSREEDEH
jgi:hypothetical protein